MTLTINRMVKSAAPKRLKVLHVGKFYPPHMGGIETHLETLCRELRKTVDVRVMVANEDRSCVEEIVDSVPVTRVPTLFTVASSPMCPGMIPRLRAYRGNIVHLHMPNPVAALAYLASGHRGQLVVTYHSDMVRQKSLGRAFEPILHAVLRRASAIITTSPNYLKSSKILARHQERCRVIPLGIRIEDFWHPDPNGVAEMQSRFGQSIILCVGRLVYYKGLEYLIRAMAQVRGQLLIVGKGPLRESLIELAGRLGVKDRVHFLGNLEHRELVQCYHAAKVFVFPSVARSEAFGIVQVEAMAAGLPVVNTNLESGVPFVSLHDQTGFTVPPNNADALASAIHVLLTDEKLRVSFGTKAKLRAQTEFGLDQMVSRTVSLYEGISSGATQSGYNVAELSPHAGML
jgi:glycosyltransferase involved in cell wall biosynthesis